MNWLLIVVIGIIIFNGWRGKRKGFIKAVFTIFSTIIAIVITLWISPYITKMLQNNDNIMNFVNTKVEELTMPDDSVDKKTEEVQYIEELPVPLLIKSILSENNNSDVYSVLSVNNFGSYVNNVLSVFLINIGAFLFIFIMVKIILHIISTTLDLVSSLPILSGINSIAGLLVGLVYGIIVVWVGFTVITLFANYEFPQYLITQINESELLSSLYNYNVILIILTDSSKVLF